MGIISRDIHVLKIPIIITDFFYMSKVESVINMETFVFYVHALNISMLITDFPYMSKVKSVTNIETFYKLSLPVSISKDTIWYASPSVYLIDLLTFSMLRLKYHITRIRHG